MNCEEIANLKDGYLDGELDAVTSQKIEQHLRDCHKCEEAYSKRRPRWLTRLAQSRSVLQSSARIA